MSVRTPASPALLLVLASLLLAPAPARAAAIIDNGRIQLGVDFFGQLNPTSLIGPPSPVNGTQEVGLRFLPNGNEATAHDCLCEGWGVGIGDTLASGSANNFHGIAGLFPVGFSSTPTTATSTVAMGPLLVTHDFAPAVETADLYRVTVTILNQGPAINDLRYRRTFDWDVEPTAFLEYVSIGGSSAATAVLGTSNDGFVSSDPFAPNTSGGVGTVVFGDFTDSGFFDQGANFDFGFGPLGTAETREFEIFYGASSTEAEAFSALAAVGAEVYSLGQTSNDPGGLGLPTTAGHPTNTFMFGFAGVGGNVVPEPSTALLVGLGLTALVVTRRGRR